MKDGTINQRENASTELSDMQAEVLEELRVKGDNGVSSMYLRTLKTLKTRLIMDDEYDPSENLSLARVVTMLERDLEVLSGMSPEEDEESVQE